MQKLKKLTLATALLTTFCAINLYEKEKNLATLESNNKVYKARLDTLIELKKVGTEIQYANSTNNGYQVDPRFCKSLFSLLRESENNLSSKFRNAQVDTKFDSGKLIKYLRDKQYADPEMCKSNSIEKADVFFGTILASLLPHHRYYLSLVSDKKLNEKFIKASNEVESSTNYFFLSLTAFMISALLNLYSYKKRSAQAI